MFFTLLVFLLVRNTISSNQSLSCYNTKVVVVKSFPKFVLDGRHPESVLYTNGTLIGSPVCVVFFGYNETHSSAWQGHVSSNSLPLDCLVESDRSTHCFSSPNLFTFMELNSGFACCCSWKNCNMRNPWFFKMFEQTILDRSLIMDRILPIFKYFLCVFAMVVLIVLETQLEEQFSKILGSPKKKETEKPSKTSSKTVMMESPSPGDPLKSPLLKSLQLQSTQISSSDNLSEISVIKNPEKILSLEKTQEGDSKNENSVQKSELEDTQSDSSGRVPLPEKPQLKMLPSGRMQRISMNYEESTYSDLQ